MASRGRPAPRGVMPLHRGPARGRGRGGVGRGISATLPAWKVAEMEAEKREREEAEKRERERVRQERSKGGAGTAKERTRSRSRSRSRSRRHRSRSGSRSGSTSRSPSKRRSSSRSRSRRSRSRRHSRRSRSRSRSRDRKRKARSRSRRSRSRSRRSRSGSRRGRSRRSRRSRSRSRRSRSRSRSRRGPRWSDRSAGMRRPAPGQFQSPPPPDDKVPEVGSLHRGRIKNILNFGCFVAIPGFRQDGLVHISQVAEQRIEKVEDLFQVGDEVWVKVMRVEDDSRHPGKKNVALSIKNVSQATSTDPGGQDLGGSDDGGRRRSGGGGGFGGGPGGGDKVLELHSLHKGRIRDIMPFGCFVSVPGYRQDGMVHISQIANQRVEKIEDYYSVGDEVWVKVMRVEDDERRPGRKKIGLSIKNVTQATSTDPGGRDLGGDDDFDGGGGRGSRAEPGPLPELFSMHSAIVNNIVDFGAFCTLDPPINRDGLVRINHVSDDFVEDVRDVVRLGQRVWVKVLEVQDNVDGNGKIQIALSMKFADQANGRDLDPGEVDWQSEQNGGNPRDRSKRLLNEKIALKVSEHGGTGRYSHGQGHLGEMVPEPAEDEASKLRLQQLLIAQQLAKSKSSHKKKKKKKKSSGKHKKSKKDKKKKKKHRSKKHKKSSSSSKKRRRHSSDESSGSDSGTSNGSSSGSDSGSDGSGGGANIDWGNMTAEEARAILAKHGEK